MKKRCLSVFLALALCLSLLTTAAFATEDAEGGDPAPQATTYTVTLNKDNQGNGTMTGGGEYAEGATVTIRAAPDAGYCLYTWVVSGSTVTLADNRATETTFTMPASDVTITANFRTHSEVWGYEENEHYKTCLYCGEVAGTRAVHSFDSASDTTCDCGYEREVAPDTPATYKVTFYPNGGTSGEMQQQTFAAGETKSLTPNAFTRTGYIFMGWNTQMDGGGTPYSDKESITPTNHLILYARWMELTITASPATLTGNGTIKLTTSLSVNKITCSESKYEHYISGGGKDWTFQMKNNVTTDLTFTIAFGGATASCTVSFVQDPNALILTPSRTSLTGNGVITLTGNKEITSITCSNDTYNTNISGSGQNWQFVMDRNVDINLRFEATAANGETAVCWVSFNQYTPPSSDDDDDYTPPIPTDTEQSENGDTVTTAEPSTVIKKDTATSTITATDGNRLVNELVRNGSDQLVIAPKIGQDVSGVEVSIPATVVKQLAERTDADLQIATGFAEVNIGSDELDGHSGSLVMEAQRTEDGISTKVSIGGVSVLDTSVMLFVSLNNLPEDGKLVVGTLQPGADALNFLPLTETTKPSTRMAMVPEDSIVSMEAAVIGPDGESYTQHERLLIDGKEYYVSGSGDGEPLSLYDKEGNIYSYDGEKAPQEIGQDTGTEYPENEFININGAVYQIHSVQRDTDGNGTLILYLDGKPAGMCQFDQYEEMDSINIYNEDYAPDKVKERQQNSNQLGTVTTGETPIDGLETGKTYNVSVVGSQDISVPGYDEAVLNSIKAETEAEKAAKEEVERLKADMEAKEAALDQMSDSDPNYWYAMTALSDAEAAYEAALAELAALANLQSATVTQTFDIPNELVGRTDVTFIAVHNRLEHTVSNLSNEGENAENAESDIRDTDMADEMASKVREDILKSIEYGVTTVSEDGKTLTATYTVSSFSPFTIYAFVETEEAEAKVIGSPFADVSTDAWYYDAVKYAYDNGLMAGTSTTERLFSPEDTTTRAQIVTILHRLEGSPINGQGKSGTFVDVPEYQWYTEAVEWAAAFGITSGTGDGTTFSPNDPITREQFAAFLYRYAQHKGYDVSVGEDTNILSYEDAFTVSEYAYPALQWACGEGIIGGMNSANGGMILDPQGSATRAQAATMLMRFCENVKK